MHSVYRSLQPRITRTLVSAWLDIDRALTTHYGAIIGLCALGQQVIATLILPYIEAYLHLLSPLMRAQRTNVIKRMEATRVYHALLNAVGSYVTDALISDAAVVYNKRSTYKRQREDADNDNDVMHDTAASVSVSGLFVPVDLSPLNALQDLFGDGLLPYVQSALYRVNNNNQLYAVDCCETFL